MYWNFGGNFNPVATTCQYSEWSKCITSFIRYIWFEAVTDVVDCLANEEVLWKVLAILLTFTTIAYFVYWKSQWKKEVKKNQERFIAVNHKIQDLELKVDIITYKTQYGIWPLQYLQEKNALANLEHFPFGLSKFTLENSWIQNMLSRDNEKKYFLDKYSDMRKNIVQRYSSIEEFNFPSYDCDDILLRQEQYNPTTDTKTDATFNHNSECQNNIDSNLEEPLQCLDARRISTLIVPPESNLNDRSKKHNLYIEENVEIHHKNSPRRKPITLDNVAFARKRTADNRDMGIVASTTSMTVRSKAFSEFQGITSNTPSKNNQLVSKSHDTLLDIQQRLESLYKTIHNYNTKNPLIPMIKFNSDSNSFDTLEAISCTIDESTENTYVLKDSNKSLKKIQNSIEYSNSATAAICELDPAVAIESAIKGNDTICNDSEKTCDQSSKFSTKNNKNIGDLDNQNNEMDARHHVTELYAVKSTDTVTILENETEAFPTVEPLDDSTSALRQEASKLKKQISSKVESQDNGTVDKENCTSNCIEADSGMSLKQGNATFGSKIIDIITEESSVSSCTERKGDFYDYKITEKNKISQDKTLPPPNHKIKRSCLKNTCNVETRVDEKVKKQKDLNCLFKINNKSFNGESSSNRIFPSSFSTVFLYNDQDNLHFSKHRHDNDITVKAKSGQDLISPTGSLSNVSVNKLISKLTENDRKSKKPNKPPHFEKTTMNGLAYNCTNSNDVKLTNHLIELTHPTDNCNDLIEETKCNDMLNEDTSKMKRCKEIKYTPKKLNDSVLNSRNNENCYSSETKTYGNSFSQCSSISNMKIPNSKLEETGEPLLKSNPNSSIAKHDIYADSSANENLIKSKLSNGKQDETLQRSKESNETVDSINFSNVQELVCNNWKPSRAKSNLDLTGVDKRQLKLTHRRSKSYINPRGLTGEIQCNDEKEDFLESSSSSSPLSSVKVFDEKKIFNNVEDITSNKSSESLCSTPSSIPAPKSISVTDGQITLKTDYSSPIVTDITEKNCIKKQSSLELIPLTHSSLKSCIPVMNNRRSPKKNFGESTLCDPIEMSTKYLLQNKAQDLINRANTDIDEICSPSSSEDKCLSDEFANFSELDNFENVEQNAIICYDLVSENQHVPTVTNQSESSDMSIQELIDTDNVTCSRAINTASAIPNVTNEPNTCVLSDELAVLNPLNSIPSVSPCLIERKETEVLVKTSTLNINT